ncbi:MAG: cytochrome c3 family protein [Desulfuromonadaceae bacterium]
MNGRNGWIIWGSVWAAILLPGLSLAAVTGLCSDCHTMHDSQQGSLVAFTRDSTGQSVFTEVPFKKLLKTDCVGCHSDAGNETILIQGERQTPVVLNLVEPTYPPDGSSSATLAGGNFYWAAQVGDEYGHNVYGISEQDFRLGGGVLAPGGTPGTVDACAGCHRSLATAETGCNGCHVVQHHAVGPNQVSTAEEGWYRFLGAVMERGDGSEVPPDGVTGIEDPSWEQNPLSSRHNTYQGASSPYGSYLNTRSISQKCTGCHGLFHGNTTANSTWIRHPVDVVIPNTPEFSGLTDYNPLVPVARRNVAGNDANSPFITLGSDVVSCISCHRAHGSPYPAMLRWGYRAWPGDDPYTGGPAFNGCAVCHTSKS